MPPDLPPPLSGPLPVLLPIGSIVPAGADGCLPRLGRAPHGAFGRAAHRIAAGLARDLGDDLVAVVLRGSAARGTAVAGASDLDLVVVRHSCAEEPEVAPERIEVEIVATTLADLLHAPAAAWLRFALAFSGWTIRGRDVVADLPDPTLGPHCIAHLRDVHRWGHRWRAMLDGDRDAAERRLTCRWLMKRIVRSAFEDVMFEVGGYTRDLHPCTEAAAARRPRQAALLRAAAALAIRPSDDRAAIAAVADPLVAWLEARRAALPAGRGG